jgi:benzoyl-CoA-dihydrodiol lyase
VRELGAEWWALRAFRELDDALLRLRFNCPEIGLILLRVKPEAGADPKGARDALLRLDASLLARQDDWFAREVLGHSKRVLKRVDVTAKTFFAMLDAGTCFAGATLDLAFACDRQYMLDGAEVRAALSQLSFGPLPMGNGITRLQTRFLADPAHADSLRERVGAPLAAEDCVELGLVTDAWDEIDWDDEIRLVVEERASLSPDALTGMEANLRFAGPETLETKVFGRLSAWQNWIFQRPNAVGPKGALTLYGRPETAEFDFRRT